MSHKKARAIGKNAIWLMIGIFSLWYSVFSIIKYIRFETFIFDLGYYDQLLWLVSKGYPLYSSIVASHPFSDHFSPSLYLLTPLYWLYASPIWLLLVQSIFVSLGAYPLYKIALDTTKQKLFSFTIAFSYLSFWGIMNAISFDFHMLTLGAPLFAFIIWFYKTQRWRLFWMSLIIMAGLQENYLIFIAFFGVYLLIKYKDVKKGLFIGLISLVVYLLLIFLFIPAITGQAYDYLPGTENSSIATVPLRLLNHPDKIKLLVMSFGSFGFIPLFSGTTWILFLEEFGGRFLGSSNPNWWSLGFHYNALLATLLSLGTIDVCSRHLKLSRILTGLLILSTVVSLVLVRPDTFTVLSPSFYNFSKTARYTDAIAHIPPLASVGSANDIGSHLTQRPVIQFLANCLDKPYMYGSDNRRCYELMPDYLIADFSEDANWNAFYPDYDRASLQSYFANLVKDASYEIVYEKNGILILKKVCSDTCSFAYSQ